MKNCISHHFNSVAGLIALAMIGALVLVLAMHGMKDETLLAILATGAVGIANQVAGIPKPPSSPPGTMTMPVTDPGTTTTQTTTQTAQSAP